MENSKAGSITQSQFAFLIVGFILGPGYIQLSRLIVSASKQDAWLSAIIAFIYPIYIILITLYIIKKCPRENLLLLSKKYYGRVLGTIFNAFFLIQFITIQASIISDTIRVSILYIIAFLTPIKISIVVLAIAFYGGAKGIKVIGKVNEYISYLAFIILIFSLYALINGELLNLKPVLGSGFKNILSGTVVTSYYYWGFEVILLFHTYVGDYKKIKRASFIAFGITVVIYIWSIFICIYNLGIDIIEKSVWPFMFVFESINIPIINNFLYIFMIAWSLVAIKSIANYYFAASYILNDITKISIKSIMIGLYPIFLYLGILLLNDLFKRNVLNVLSPVFVIFNMLFFTITGAVIKIKQKKNSVA